MKAYTRFILEGGQRDLSREKGRGANEKYAALEKNRRLFQRLLNLRRETRVVVKPPVTREEFDVWQRIKELHRTKLLAVAERKDKIGNVLGYEIYVITEN